jgi:hypothetical protein
MANFQILYFLVATVVAANAAESSSCGKYLHSKCQSIVYNQQNYCKQYAEILDSFTKVLHSRR